MDLGRLSGQSAQPGLSVKTLAVQKLHLPPLPTQQRIAAVLSALDDKIELNNSINANLEAQAQALFRSWFVDFEPWGGEMPEGWREGKLEEIAVQNKRVFNPLKNPDRPIEHFSIPAFDASHYPVFETSNDIQSNKTWLSQKSLMISKLNPATKRLWYPTIHTETAVCSTEFVVLEAKEPVLKDFLYSVMDSSGFTDHLCAHVTGTTNSRQRSSAEAALSFEMPIPDTKTLKLFVSVVSPMYAATRNHIEENHILSALRDALLPKLMSGEIDVEKVEIPA